jgi:hypothetical protein
MNKKTLIPSGKFVFSSGIWLVICLPHKCYLKCIFRQREIWTANLLKKYLIIFCLSVLYDRRGNEASKQAVLAQVIERDDDDLQFCIIR